MEQPIITTNGTNQASKLSAKLSALLPIIFAIAIFSFFRGQLEPYPKYVQEKILEDCAGLIIISAISFLALSMFVIYQFLITTSYVNVYADRMEGKGIQNVIQVVDFKLSYSQITSVTSMGNSVYINTPGGKYRILTDAKTAAEIFAYYNNRAQ